MNDYILQPKPSIISRQNWNAADARGCGGSNTKSFIIIHHLGDFKDSLATYCGDNEKDYMKRVQEIHLEKGLSDIGYNYAIGIKGSILEGRSLNTSGDHAFGYNANSIGILFHGNYNIRSLSKDQEEALVDLLSWLSYTYNISTANILGHRNVASTPCPGINIIDKLSGIRGRVDIKLTPHLFSRKRPLN